MHELLQHQINSIVLFSTLMFVEGGQFLWFALHPKFSFLWKSDITDYLRLALRFIQVCCSSYFAYILQVDYFLGEGDSNFFFVFFCFAAIIQLVIALGIAIVIYSLHKDKKKISPLSTSLLNLMSFYCLLIKTIAPLPFFHIFVASLICRDGDPILPKEQCFNGINLAVFILAIPCIIIFFIFSLVTNLLYIDLNPSSNAIFAAPYAHIELVKLTLKLIVPVYVVIDYDVNFWKFK